MANMGSNGLKAKTGGMVVNPKSLSYLSFFNALLVLSEPTKNASLNLTAE